MDQKLLFLINREWTHPGLDWLMVLVSSFDLWLWILLPAIVWMLVRGDFRLRAFVLCAGVIVGINDGGISRTLKHWADRPRPHQALNEVRQVELAKSRPRWLALGRPLVVKMSRMSFGEVEGRSFPSSHTVNTLSVAVVCALFFRRRGWLAFGPALLVAYSRIYLGSHWPSDVLVSIFLGLGSTLFLFAGLTAVWQRFAPSYWPRGYAALRTLPPA